MRLVKRLGVVSLLAQLPSLNAECLRGKRSLATCGATEYNECNDRCCGGVLYSAEFGEFAAEAGTPTTRQCCGHSTDGTWYDSDAGGGSVNLCCAAWYEFTDDDGATKTHKIFSGVATSKSCCTSGTGAPVTIDVSTEMCCNGHVAFAGDTSYSSCCGSVSYDRRLKSCPCHDGVLFDAAESDDSTTEEDETEGKNLQCCRNPDPEGASTSYDSVSQICCQDGGVGDRSNSVCCGDKLITTTITGADVSIECCHTDTGYEGINIKTHFCCGNEVRTRTVEYPREACCNDDSDRSYDTTTDVCCTDGVARGDQCCGGSAYDSRFQLCCETDAETGVHDRFSGADLTLTYDSCCHAEPFLGSSSICCDGTLSASTGAGGESYTSCCGSTAMESDFVCCDDRPLGPFEAGSCCGTAGYSTATHTCCNNVVAGPFSHPGCCGTTAFDSDGQTCCGNTLVTNPDVTRDGITSTSTTTRCCQEADGASYTWRGYDYTEKTCCNVEGGSHRGVIIDSEPEGQCCGSSYITSDEQCCQYEGISAGVSRTAGERSECCGRSSTFDSTTHYCCDRDTGALCEIVEGVHEELCGDTAYTRDTHMCCHGEVRELRGVAHDDAICCGDTCVDSALYWCCSGEIYSKGKSIGISMPHKDCCDGADCDVCTCSWTNWSEDCSSACGAGTLTRERSICVDATGTDCTGGDGDGETETKACTGPCDSDVCNCSWTEWTACSTTCDPGMRTRERVCKDARGDDCTGGDAFDTPGFIEMMGCHILERDVCCTGDLCDWTEWSGYGTCSKKKTACDVGKAKRKRRCKVPGEIEGTAKCPGKRRGSKVCNKKTKWCGLKCEDPYFDLVIMAHTDKDMNETKFAHVRKFADELNKAASTVDIREPGKDLVDWRLDLTTYHCVKHTYSLLEETPDTKKDVTQMIQGIPGEDTVPRWEYEHDEMRDVSTCIGGKDHKLSKALESLMGEWELIRESRHETRDPGFESMDFEYKRENITYAGILVIVLTSESDDSIWDVMHDVKHEMDKVIVVGVGDGVSEEYVKSVASFASYWEGDFFYTTDPITTSIYKHHHKIDTYDELPKLAEEIMSDICSTKPWEIDECEVDNGGCAHDCATTSHGKQCYCRGGRYMLGPYGRNCYSDKDDVLETLEMEKKDAKDLALLDIEELHTALNETEFAVFEDFLRGFLPRYLPTEEEEEETGGRA